MSPWLISKTVLLDSESVPGFHLCRSLSRLPEERMQFCYTAFEPGPRLGAGRRKQAAGPPACRDTVEIHS